MVFWINIIITFHLQLSIGTVDSDHLLINLSLPLYYTSNTNYSVFSSIVGLTSDTYLLLFHPSPYAGPGDLHVIPVTTAVGKSLYPILGTEFVMKNSYLVNYFSSARISDNSAVVVFVNADDNFSITSLLVMLQDGQISNRLINN